MRPTTDPLNGEGTQFVSTGHSLGGGLAQQAAYADADGSIKYVRAASGQ